MPKRKRTNNQDETGRTANLFADILILPGYRISKMLVSKTSFKDNFSTQKGHFIFDSFCSVFVLYVLYWMGGWTLFGNHFYFFWYLGGSLAVIMAVCFFVGRLRRLHHEPELNIEQRINAEEKREFKDYTKQPRYDNYKDDKEVQEALIGLGYSRTEAKQGAQYANTKVPNGELSDKITEALKHFDTSTNN